MARPDYRQNADLRMPPTTAERIAGVILAAIIGVVSAAALVAWWSS